MITQEEIRVTSIGHIANQALLRRPAGCVMGTTSQGIYLQLYDDLTLFLSRDPYRGPLTINFRGGSEIFSSIQSDENFELINDSIIFKESSQAISIHKPLIWKLGEPPTPRKQKPDANQRIYLQVRSLHPGHPYLPLLDYVTGVECIQSFNMPEIDSVYSKLSTILESENLSGVTLELVQLLGLGPGLTPLGDDLLLGILLAITRSRRQKFWEIDPFITSFNSLAKTKTNRLSLSLLSCAVQGYADERIIRVMDGLIAGREIPDHDLENLLDWGSSSGMAVLAGMLMVVSEKKGSGSI